MRNLCETQSSARAIRFLIITVLMLAATAAGARTISPFNGVIVDGQGRPIPKAKIWTRNAASFATSDKQGRFGFSEVQSDDTLHVKIKKDVYSIGIDDRNAIRIVVADTRTTTVFDEPEIADLGYGYVKRRERIVASSGITGAQLRATGQTSIIKALTGLVPGLEITPSPNGGTQVNIRGIHSFVSSSEPLYVVDGIFVSSLDGYNVFDVDRVEVLKDATIYGSRGANGAIIVTMKRGGE